MRCLLFGSLILALLCCTSACDSDHDVTSNAKYWGEFKPGSQFVAQMDLFVFSFEGRQASLRVPGEDNLPTIV